MTEGNFIFSVSQNETNLPERHVNVDPLRAHWTLWNVGAVVGLVGSALVCITGLSLSATSYFIGEPTSLINSIGVWLTVATIPLLMFGAVCLDKIDEKAKQYTDSLKAKRKARLENLD